MLSKYFLLCLTLVSPFSFPWMAQKEASPVTIRKILIIYTGGTLGMKETPHGLVPQKGFLEGYLKNHSIMCDKVYTEEHWDPEDHRIYTPIIHHKYRVSIAIEEFEHPIDSSDINTLSWIDIGTRIWNAYLAYDSFIVLHGTDTLPYTASMLSFMLENLNKTVIVTAAQIPFADFRNDAIRNVIESLALVALRPNIPEVVTVFGNYVFRGNRIYKEKNEQYDAFTSPNYPSMAQFDINVKFTPGYEELPPPTEPFNVQLDLEKSISLVTIDPFITYAVLEGGLKTKGAVLLTYGAGNMQSNRPEFLFLIKEAIARGVIIINISQCRVGRVEAIYATGNQLLELGVIEGYDMTYEAALAKLSYLLGKYPGTHNIEKVKEEVKKDLRGECTIDVEETTQLRVSNLRHRTE